MTGSVVGEGPDAWHPDDALLVPLAASDGRRLDFLSLDEPVDGRRPGDAAPERLRREVASEFRDYPVAISVSAGISDSGPCEDAETLMRAANRALYAAKRLGRDRCVVHHAETPAMLDALADDRAGGQLEAAMLAGRDARPARRRQRPPLGNRQPLRRSGIAEELWLAPDKERDRPGVLT